MHSAPTGSRRVTKIAIFRRFIRLNSESVVVCIGGQLMQCPCQRRSHSAVQPTGPQVASVSLERLTYGKLGAQFASSASTSKFGADGDSPDGAMQPCRNPLKNHESASASKDRRHAAPQLERLFATEPGLRAGRGRSMPSRAKTTASRCINFMQSAIAAFATRKSARFMAK